MEIRQLRLFREVVDAGSISEAARRMNLSQPPLSYHMKMLEQELGVTLFHRGKKNIELTSAGKLLYERAETMLSLESAVSREVSEEGTKKTLRIGVTPTTSPLLISALSKLHQKEKKLYFDLSDGTSFSLREMLEKGMLDCTLVRGPIRLDGLEARLLRKEPFIAVGDTDGFRVDGEVTIRELAPFPLIIYRRYETFLYSAFHNKGASPSVRAVCDDARTALSMARAGIGLALLPRSMAPLVRDIWHRTIADDDLETDILFVCRKDRQADPLVVQLIGLLEEAIQEA
ncbi:MAG: LysR family transcriptional regulator [Lachnospiraceae bacterium]|nr:LysR family transcriptional regulator [Lachnospiraceae bacterium]